MHVIVGLALLIVVVGGLFLIVSSGVLKPVFMPLNGVFGPITTSTPASNNSQYYGEVRVQAVSTGSGLDKTQLISLAARPVKEEGIFLTGWSVRTDLKTYFIPKAENLYSPSVSGIPPEDIYAKTGAVINLYSGQNTVKGQPQAIRSGLNEWRLWLGANFLTVPHGTVDLYDEKGKLVDEYKY